jgi:hypothetical protein
MKTEKNADASERPLDLLVMWLAGCIDNVLIWFYVWRGDADTPCGRIQSWAREARKNDGFETTMKAKRHFDT